ncbi:MAG: tRNA-dependent cyclodipeptide synthase [Patescibacteria group bacterium]|nr:tRNA-dependent cyclodipeptide synthase [Patescibacteria group bacterium]
MKIGRCLNTTKEEIEAKKFNIFIGISLGNKYFTRENIKGYIDWALANTKEKVAILIPDKIHSVNYEVKSGYKKERAEKLAHKEGDKVLKIVESILGEFDKARRGIVDILTWDKIETEEYKRMVNVLRQEFSIDDKFRSLILEIVKENVKSDKLTESDYEKLASYPLEELPMLISGFEYNGVKYDLLPYPGISKIDYLVLDLQEGKSFPDITRKLNIKNRLGLIEAYAE